MMKLKRQTRISAFVTLLLIGLLSSCSSDIESVSTDKKKVFLTFQLNTPYTQTRAQINNPSINEDQKDKEDVVNQLSILLFESDTGEKVTAKTGGANTVLEVPAGTYDIYFVANQLDGAFVHSIADREGMDLYLQGLQQYTNYHGAKSSAFNGFPMARVYKRQHLMSGGTYQSPMPFKPRIEQNEPLAPISSYGKDYQAGTSLDKVTLVRAVAKVDLTLLGPGAEFVERISYCNAASSYSYQELPLSTFSLSTEASKESVEFVKEDQNYVLYVPEKRFATHEEKGWMRDKLINKDEPIGAVNYIKVELTTGHVYKIPVISNPLKTTGRSYFDVARDSEVADYNVIRNHEYRYELTIPKPATTPNELHVVAHVLPWNKVESEIHFGQPKYESMVNKTTVDNERRTLQVSRYSNLTFSITISEPQGALWQVSLTNGLDFAVRPHQQVTDPRHLGAVRGVVDKQTTYVFDVVPLKPFEGDFRYTELYLLIDGKEVQLVPHLLEANEESGPAKRYQVQQVE